MLIPAAVSLGLADLHGLFALPAAVHGLPAFPAVSLDLADLRGLFALPACFACSGVLGQLSGGEQMLACSAPGPSS